MKRINILFIFIFSVPSATFSQQSDLLEKYRSMAVEYNHDLKAADKHISASIELEKAARKDLRPFRVMPTFNIPATPSSSLWTCPVCKTH